MKKQDTKLREWKPVHRLAFAFFALMFIGMGSLTLLRGKLHYPNVWGEPVFAPFVIFGGFLALIAVFMHRKKSK